MLTFDDLMESAGTINAVRDATVYPFEHPVEFAKGIYKLGAVGVKAMQYQYSAQDYVNFGMSVREGVSRWRSDLNSAEAYTRGYAKGELLGLFMPGSGAEVGVAKLGMFASRAGRHVEITARFSELASGVTKDEARILLRGGSLPITELQTKAILKQLKSGRMESVSIKKMYNGQVHLSFERSGHTSGFQRMSFKIDEHGTNLRIVQTAFDNEGNIEHQIPGSSKNNLYDVKL